ncbi:hypothetical protein RQP46_006967 [Phenoliferia psychrophenolica]
MGWFSFLDFRRTSSPDYETLLSQLEQRIKDREQHLLSIRLRERRANALFITYGLGLWAVYVLLWWLGVVGGLLGEGHAFGKALQALPVVGGPVLIIFTRRILRSWYTRKREAEETTLRELKKQQREQVEELKRKTGYYSTRNLLEKYDEVIKKNAETRGLPPPTAASAVRPRPSGMLSPPSTPQRPPGSQGPTPAGTPQQGTAAFPLLPPAPSTPAPRTVFDKLADALLGVAAEDGSPNSKYALICAKCFSHNGLVPKEEFDSIQYQCPRCGFFNPRKSAVSRPGGLDALGQGGSRRRVQSMMIPSSRPPGSPEQEEHQVPTVDNSKEDDEDEDGEPEPEEVLLEAGSQAGQGEPLRQRRGKSDAMDVDD